MAIIDEEEKRKRAAARQAIGQQYQQKREELLAQNEAITAEKAQEKTAGQKASYKPMTAAQVEMSIPTYSKKKPGDNDMAKAAQMYSKESVDVSSMSLEDAMGFATRIVYDDERDDFLKRWQASEKKRNGKAPTLEEMRDHLNRQKPGGLYADANAAYSKQVKDQFAADYKAIQEKKQNQATISAQMTVLSGLTDLNGNAVDVNTASLEEIIRDIKADPDEGRRADFAGAITVLTKTPGSRFYGVEFDKTAAEEFINSAALTQEDYDNQVERFAGRFNPLEGHEQENLDEYAYWVDVIENGGYSAYVKTAYKRALDAAYRQQTQKDELPDLSSYVSPQRESDAPEEEKKGWNWVERLIMGLDISGDDGEAEPSDQAAIKEVSQPSPTPAPPPAPAITQAPNPEPTQTAAPTPTLPPEAQEEKPQEEREKPAFEAVVGEWQGPIEKAKEKHPSFAEALEDAEFMASYTQKMMKDAKKEGKNPGMWQGPRRQSVLERSIKDGAFQQYWEEYQEEKNRPKEVQGPQKREEDAIPTLADAIGDAAFADAYAQEQESAAAKEEAIPEGSIDLSGNPVSAWMYAREGKGNLLTEETRSVVDELVSSSPAAKALSGLDATGSMELYEQAASGDPYALAKANKARRDYLTGGYVSVLGSTLSYYADLANSDEWPEGLRDAMLGVVLSVGLAAEEAYERGEFDCDLDKETLYDAYIRYEPSATAPLVNAESAVNKMREDQKQRDLLSVEAEKKNAQELLEQRRARVRSGNFTQEDYDGVMLDAPVVTTDNALNDSTYRDMLSQIRTDRTLADGMDDSWHNRMASRYLRENGLTDDLGSVAAMQYKDMLAAFEEDVLLQDVRVAKALGYGSLEEMYAKWGGMDVDKLHMRAETSMHNLAQNVTQEDVAAIEQVASLYKGTEDSSGYYVGAVVKGLEHGTYQTTADILEAVWATSTISLEGRADAVAQNRHDFVKRYGYAVAPYMYAQAMYKYAENAPDKSHGDAIKAYLDTGLDVFQLGIDPMADDIIMDAANAMDMRAQAVSDWAHKTLNAKQGKWFEVASGTGSTLTMQFVATASSIVTGNPFIGNYIGYGLPSAAQEMRNQLGNGATRKEALVMGVAHGTSDTLANMASSERFLEKMRGFVGYAPLVNLGAKNVGNIGAARTLLGTTKAMAMGFVGQLTDEVGDTFKEGVYWQFIGGATQSHLDGANTIKAIVDGGKNVDVVAAASDMVIQAPETILYTLPLAALGGLGEGFKASRAKATRLAATGDAQAAGEFFNALGIDLEKAENRDALNTALHEAAVGEAAAVIALTDEEVATRVDEASKAQEQADAHAVSEENSRQAAEDGLASATEAQERMNAGELNPELVTQIANGVQAHTKNSQSVLEHQREKEQKQAEADKGFTQAMQAAEAKAEAEIAAREETLKAQRAEREAQARAEIEKKIQPVRERLDQVNAQIRELRKKPLSRFSKKLESLRAERKRLGAELTSLEEEYDYPLAAEDRAEVDAFFEEDAGEAELDPMENARVMEVEEFIEQTHPGATDEQREDIYDSFFEDDEASELPDEEEPGAKLQEANAEFAARVSRKFGVNIRFGNLGEAEGAYSRKADTIYLDTNATQGDVIRRVMVHELTHRAEGTKAYSELESALIAMRYGEDRAQFDSDIASKRRQYESQLAEMGRTGEFDEAAARKEIVADICGELLSGNDEMINRLVAEKPSVARQILDAIKSVINKLRGVRDPELDNLRRIEKLLEKGLNEADRKQREAKAQISDPQTGTELAGTIGEDTYVQYSLASWTDSEREIVRSNLINAGFAAADVDHWIDDVNSVAREIAADRDRLDFTPADNHVMLKPNQEYVKTLDASTLCAKRLIYQGTFNAIQHAMPNTPITSDGLIELRNMMAEMGYETPCGICYVESRRRNLGTFAKQWLDNYDAKDGYQPTLADVTTTDGLERMRKEHPEVYESFTAEMNRKGSNNPKVVQLRTDYRGDIRSLTPKQVQKIIEIGGLRVQSFSDFETPHLLDMMQAVLDMAEQGLTSQAYTKVPDFAAVFGDTGIKINLSLIAEGTGLDENGNLIFSSYEGMDFDRAMELRDMYSENVGTILVGLSDDHIRAAMADPRIDYIIPFHKSGWGQKQLEALTAMRGYEDYTSDQNEKRITGETKSGKKTYKNVKENFHPVDYWDYEKSGKENAEIYLRMCAEDGRIPKFSQFLTDNGDGSFSLPKDGSADGYWKLLIDYKMYDNEGNGAPQRAVMPEFNMDEAMRVLGEYEGGADTLPVAQDVVERFVGERKKAETSLPDDAQFALRWSKDGKRYVEIEEDILAGVPEDQWVKTVMDTLRDRFKDGIPVGNSMIQVTRKTRKEWSGSKDTGRLRFFDKLAYADKMRASGSADEIVQASGNYVNEEPTHIRKDGTVDFSRGTVLVSIGGNDYEAKVVTGSNKDGSVFLYDMLSMTPTSIQKKTHRPGSRRSVPRSNDASSDNRIHENDSVVNGDSMQNLQEDAQFSLPSKPYLNQETSAWRKAQRAEAQREESRRMGERKFVTDTLQASRMMPAYLKQTLFNDPTSRYYERDSNDEQIVRAYQTIQQEGREAAIERILSNDNLPTRDEIAQANVLMAMAAQEGDMSTLLALSRHYAEDTTEIARALQAQKIFKRMTPIGIMQATAAQAEGTFDSWRKEHEPKRADVEAKARAKKEDVEKKQGGDPIAMLGDGKTVLTRENSKWGIPINEQQAELIRQYKLEKVSRPGIHYNRATLKQRMLEAILATPNVLEKTNEGLTLIERLEYMKAGAPVVTNADLQYIGRQMAMYAAMDVDSQEGRIGQLALARMYEANANITQADLIEKINGGRFLNMLFNATSPMRNVIGNTLMTGVNSTSDLVANALDTVISLGTGKHTKALITPKEMVEGWEAFVQETVDTYRDYFIDKAIVKQGEGRFDVNRRGRVYQSGAAEAARITESFLMSVGDRNFWKMAYVNSMNEQMRVARMNGTELDYETARAQAEFDANYATFNEDNKVRDAMNALKNAGVFGKVIDLLMPFTGVPTNIIKRQLEYGPAGLAYSCFNHAVRAFQGKNFDQLAFVEEMARGLTGTGLMVLGFGLKELSMIKGGTGEEEDSQAYYMRTARGDQYTPYITVGDQNISLSTFAPAISPILMGAAVYDVLESDASMLTAVGSAMSASLDSIIDASYFSAIQDVLGGDGTFAENLGHTLLETIPSQGISTLLSQFASHMDPYVRDTKDKDWLVQTFNKAKSRIPWLRETLPIKYDVTGEAVKNTKEGWRAFFDPFTTTEAENDKAVDELIALYERTGETRALTGYLISSGSYSLSVTKTIARRTGTGDAGYSMSLTTEQKQEINRRYGDMLFNGGRDVDGIRKLVDSREWEWMTDEERVEAIADMRSETKAAVTEWAIKEYGKTR